MSFLRLIIVCSCVLSLAWLVAPAEPAVSPASMAADDDQGCGRAEQKEHEKKEVESLTTANSKKLVEMQQKYNEGMKKLTTETEKRLSEMQ